MLSIMKKSFIKCQNAHLLFQCNVCLDVKKKKGAQKFILILKINLDKQIRQFSFEPKKKFVWNPEIPKLPPLIEV